MTRARDKGRSWTVALRVGFWSRVGYPVMVVRRIGVNEMDDQGFYHTKVIEAGLWLSQHDPLAPKPRIIQAVLDGEPLPAEPLEFEDA